MVRKLGSPRWSGSNKHPLKGESSPSERKYVDFGDQEESEAAVERWLTSPASQKYSQPKESPQRSTPKSSPSRHKSSSAKSQKISSGTSGPVRMSRFSPMQGKRILRERLQSRSKGAEKQQAKTVTPNVQSEKSEKEKVPETPCPVETTSTRSPKVFNFDILDIDSESDAPTRSTSSKKLVSVVSAETPSHSESKRSSRTSGSRPVKEALSQEEDVSLQGSDASPRGNTPKEGSSTKKQSPTKKQSLSNSPTLTRSQSLSQTPSVDPNLKRPSTRRLSSADHLSSEKSVDSKRSFFSSHRRKHSSESDETEKTTESKKKSIFNFSGRKSNHSYGPVTILDAKSMKLQALPNAPIDKFVIHKAEEVLQSLQDADEERELRQQTTRQLTVPARTNRIKLNVYDLLSNEVVMPLPWGCDFPIGRCFNVINSGLHNLGTGAYHVGVEINGIEYAYGANQTKGATGIFSCMPRNSPGYQFRSTIDFGERVLVREVDDYNGLRERHVDGREVLREMTEDYMGMDYDLLRKNCCTFAHDACLRLGVKEEEIPSWFRNLCVAGALTQDAANSTFEPITQALSACADMDSPFDTTVRINDDRVVEADA